MVQSEKAVPSPCVDICALDNNDICMGCYRSVEEITYWNNYNNQQKREVLERAEKRARDANAFL